MSHRSRMQRSWTRKRKFEKKWLHRQLRHEENNSDYNIKLVETRFKSYRHRLSDFAFWFESHSTKPKYKQINRQTIRKWDDAA